MQGTLSISSADLLFSSLSFFKFRSNSKHSALDISVGGASPSVSSFIKRFRFASAQPSIILSSSSVMVCPKTEESTPRDSLLMVSRFRSKSPACNSCPSMSLPSLASDKTSKKYLLSITNLKTFTKNLFKLIFKFATSMQSQSVLKD